MISIKTSPKREIMCVIPARAGSKGIPGKNTVDFAGKPLLAWTIEAAKEASSVGVPIVSTEDDNIASIARSWGAECPFVRPAHLADDNVHAVQAVKHALRWSERVNGTLPYGVMMLLPTSPFRTAEHIDSAAQMFLKQNATAVIGVVDLGKHMTNLRYCEGGRLTRVAPEVPANQQRNNVPTLYGVSGAMFIARTALLLERETFHLDGAIGFVMHELSALDVNNPSDLYLARWLKDVDWHDPAEQQRRRQG